MARSTGYEQLASGEEFPESRFSKSRERNVGPASTKKGKNPRGGACGITRIANKKD